MNTSGSLQKALSEWLPPVAMTIGLIVAWEVLVDVLDVQHWLLPPPSVIAVEIADSFGFLMRHARVTAAETVI